MKSVPIKEWFLRMLSVVKKVSVSRLMMLTGFFLTTLVVFYIGKLLFAWQGLGLDWHEALRKGSEAWLHGFWLDVATTGYILLPIWLFLLITVWIGKSYPRLRKWILFVYLVIIALLTSAIIVGDTMLYPYWLFKIDATIFNYLGQPEGITNSVTPGTILMGIALWMMFLVVSLLIWSIPISIPVRVSKQRVADTVVLILVGGLILLGIRGGVGRSTANVGMAYYCNDTKSNHAAVNPVFSLISSISKSENFSKHFQFFEEGERAKIFDGMGFNSSDTTTAANLLNTDRPNVLIILMEGMGAQFVDSLGGKAGVTPNIDRLSQEGVWFTNCYANSYRTDRGMVSTLSGHAGAPTVSVMRVQSKVNVLPGIAKTLRDAGYNTDFVYGGDINFTNMKGYLLQTGYQHTMGEEDFPLSVHRTHAWGVTDNIVFDTLYQHIVRQPQTLPWHISMLTLASHEPWGVPYDRIPDDKMANGMAYLDDCIGKFIDRFRQTPQWQNTVVVILPDHGILYPSGLTEDMPEKHRIPMLWIGGAVKGHTVIDKICNQSDMAATLLSQLRLPHEDFRFSRNIMSEKYQPCAFFTWASGIGCVAPDGTTVYDTSAKRVLLNTSATQENRMQRIRAYLQTVYKDLSENIPQQK